MKSCLGWLKRPKKCTISSSLESCNSCTAPFDLWMSRIRMDTFIVIIHFLNDQLGAFSCNCWFFLDIKNYLGVT